MNYFSSLIVDSNGKRPSLLSISLLSTFALSVASGCGGKNTWEKTHPVSGSVTLKNSPIANADLAFFPVDEAAPETVRPKAKTGEDGTFQAWTYEQGDGLPAGNYKVTVVRNEVTVSRDTIVAKPNDLPAKYAKKDSTDIVVEIKAGENALPAIELK